MERHTHYVPAFTRKNEQGQQETACRMFVSPANVAPLGVTPSCWGCALWLHEVAKRRGASRWRLHDDNRT